MNDLAIGPVLRLVRPVDAELRVADRRVVGLLAEVAHGRSCPSAGRAGRAPGAGRRRAGPASATARSRSATVASRIRRRPLPPAIGGLEGVERGIERLLRGLRGDLRIAQRSPSPATATGSSRARGSRRGRDDARASFLDGPQQRSSGFGIENTASAPDGAVGRDNPPMDETIGAPLRLALAQVNPTVGDVDANAALAAEWIGRARESRGRSRRPPGADDLRLPARGPAAQAALPRRLRGGPRGARRRRSRASSRWSAARSATPPSTTGSRDRRRPDRRPATGRSTCPTTASSTSAATSSPARSAS